MNFSLLVPRNSGYGSRLEIKRVSEKGFSAKKALVVIFSIVKKMVIDLIPSNLYWFAAVYGAEEGWAADAWEDELAEV